MPCRWDWWHRLLLFIWGCSLSRTRVWVACSAISTREGRAGPQLCEGCSIFARSTAACWRRSSGLSPARTVASSRSPSFLANADPQHSKPGLLSIRRMACLGAEIVVVHEVASRLGVPPRSVRSARHCHRTHPSRTGTCSCGMSRQQTGRQPTAAVLRAAQNGQSPVLGRNGASRVGAASRARFSNMPLLLSSGVFEFSWASALSDGSHSKSSHGLSIEHAVREP